MRTSAADDKISEAAGGDGRMMQTRLKQKDKRRFDYGHAQQINYVTGDIQRIETSRGCPHLCPYCKEPRELEDFPLPEITKPFVKILDMNFLWQPDILERIESLHTRCVYDKK